ncbi:type II toxin-antitoxin system VapC family toxin [Pseudonocardia sp. KRD-182]|uniref:type II toxin-antitoxin system VapC family toxin n=1 Tax=Pseudonocardia oceani TaxID=2792013 RepID=UPI001C49E43E|nr:type II toxin-antitoxin system VapC family toxin [Pseudonocardia oceani]MBW0112082.1 type II toxin-antitoxin system VapC family toxin [Pseudonocardia oceani]
MIVLDTTVLVYSVGTEHRFRGPCARLLDAVASGMVVATTTPEVLQEFAHVRARRRDRDDAADLAEAFSDFLAPLITVDEDAFRAGLRIFRRYPRLGSFDAVLAASAVAAGATTVVSADAAFADLTDIRHVVPDEAGVSGLVPTGAT